MFTKSSAETPIIVIALVVVDVLPNDSFCSNSSNRRMKRAYTRSREEPNWQQSLQMFYNWLFRQIILIKDKLRIEEKEMLTQGQFKGKLPS